MADWFYEGSLSHSSTIFGNERKRKKTFPENIKEKDLPAFNPEKRGSSLPTKSGSAYKEKGLPAFNPEKRGSSLPTKSGSAYKEKGLPAFNPEKRGSSLPTKSGYLSNVKQGSQSIKLSTKSGSKSDKDYITWYNHYMEAIPMMDNLDLYKKLITTSSIISESEKRAFNDAMNSLGKRGKNR